MFIATSLQDPLVLTEKNFFLLRTDFITAGFYFLDLKVYAERLDTTLTV